MYEYDQALVDRYAGGHAVVWLYTPSLRRVALWISYPDRETSLYVVGVSCTHIAGPFHWSNVRFTLTEHVTEHETLRRLEDAGNGFALDCSSVMVFEHPMQRQINDFEDLIDSDPPTRLRAKVTRFTGNTRHLGLSGELPKPAWVEITPAEGDGNFYLLYFAANGECITDTWHQSLAEAKGQAEFEFETTEADWEVVRAD